MALVYAGDTEIEVSTAFRTAASANFVRVVFSIFAGEFADETKGEFRANGYF